jgi:hypothetical protein
MNNWKTNLNVIKVIKLQVNKFRFSFGHFIKIRAKRAFTKKSENMFNIYHLKFSLQILKNTRKL